MFRWEFAFFTVVLMASLASKIVPEGSAAWMLAQAVFVLAFALFAAALLRSHLAVRRLGRERMERGSTRPI